MLRDGPIQRERVLLRCSTRSLGDPGEARTHDPVIKSHLLYQLSYRVIFPCSTHHLGAWELFQNGCKGSANIRITQDTSRKLIKKFSTDLSKVTRKPFALSQVFLLFSGRKSFLLVKKKAPSRSGLPLSRHVVLKTRHANPNIHVRRY